MDKHTTLILIPLISATSVD